MSRRSAFPLATIAAYGPDNRQATKLAVSVFTRPGQKDPVELRRWFATNGDVRDDAIVAAEIADFLKGHGVKQTVTGDRIIGCPHEEGIDYSIGETCPRCPFWAGVDRWTHEPTAAPAQSNLTPEEILRQLSVVTDTQPVAALAAADAHREALIEPLMRAIERGLEDPEGLSDDEGMLFSYAMYLLAKWREPRAHPLIVRWLLLPGRQAFTVGGDVVTEEGGRFLASTCNGQLDAIKALIVNRDANEYCRGQAVRALALLAAWGDVAYESVVDHFVWLAREGLEREPNHAWDCLAADCADLEALRVFPELRRAFDEELVAPGFMAGGKLDEVERARRGRTLARFRDENPPISDVASATRWWACYSEPRRRTAQELAGLLRQNLKSQDVRGSEPGTPRQAQPPQRSIGRNDPCPCGSGKKYKKCCVDKEGA